MYNYFLFPNKQKIKKINLFFLLFIQSKNQNIYEQIRSLIPLHLLPLKAGANVQLIISSQQIKNENNF